MKKPFVMLILLTCLILSSCGTKSGFSENENGDIIALDGTEYIYLCNEGSLELLGRKQLIGKISGENASEPYGFDIGLYACEHDTDKVMLLRYMPNNEWGSFYRKKSEPMIDITGKGLIRLEFISYQEESPQYMYSVGSEHIACGKGISGKENVSDFFKDILAGETAEAAGLYDKISDVDGTICYELGKVYGFYQGENAAVKPYEVWSFDDKDYSITIDDVQYVLPKEYLEKLGYR